MDEFEELQQTLSNTAAAESLRQRAKVNKGRDQPGSPTTEEKDISEHSQWAVLPNDSFMAVGGTQRSLPPGAYTLGASDRGILFHSKRILTDDLIDLGDSNARKVIEEIRLFWTKKEKYRSKGLLYKRGILLYGPAGSGKTATMSMLVRDLISIGGIVLLVQLPPIAIAALPILRRIEPERPLIVILEDVEEIIGNHGEHELLGLLDGEHQTDNVVHLASTNFPEQLGARIINRPSRFDMVRKIDMPSALMRETYLRKVMDKEPFDVHRWVHDTEKLSIAHLKELVIATTCLDQPYETVIERLRKMGNAPKSTMYSEKVGFASKESEAIMSPATVQVGR